MNQNTNKQMVIIVGPTASGKSDLAIKIAKKYGGEIISADSRQVYRRMDIGTGKVPRDRIRIPDSRLSKSKIKNQKSKIYYSEGVRHHLIDVASPKKQFTVDDFKRLGEKAVKEILAKGKTPIIVGGTGFYIDVLLGRMNVAKVPPNPKLRKRFDRLTAEHLFKMLLKLDPQRAKIIDRHNKRRLIRAIEILLAPSKTQDIQDKNNPFSTKYAMAKSVEQYEVIWLGINPGKEKVAKNIKIRLDKRLSPSFAKASVSKQGMIGEVEKLHKQGVSWKRLDDFGLEYRWVSRWLIKNLKLKIKNYNSKFKSSEEYIYLLRDIVRYSKRQMTWFKRNKEINWFTKKLVEGLENRREINRLFVRFLDS